MLKTYSLFIIKPGFVDEKIAIKNVLEKNEIKVVEEKIERIDPAKLEKHYEEHQGKHFYNKLMDYMANGKIGSVFFNPVCDVMVVSSEKMEETEPEFIARTRSLVEKTIRPLFGLKQGDIYAAAEEFDEIRKTANVIHASDSQASAKREIANMFPQFAKQNLCCEELSR